MNSTNCAIDLDSFSLIPLYVLQKKKKIIFLNNYFMSERCSFAHIFNIIYLFIVKALQNGNFVSKHIYS